MATKGMKFHWHVCDLCGFAWRHSGKERTPEENDEAHACADCGAVLPEPFEGFTGPELRRYFD